MLLVGLFSGTVIDKSVTEETGCSVLDPGENGTTIWKKNFSKTVSIISNLQNRNNCY